MPSTIHAAWMHAPEPESGSHLFVWAEDIEFASRMSTSRATDPRFGSGDDRMGRSSSRSTSRRPTFAPRDADQRRSSACPPDVRESAREGSARTRAAKIPSHPEQAPIGSLRALLNELAPGLNAEAWQPANATVWLPTVNNAPALRRSLIHSAQGTNGSNAEQPQLCPWQVTGLQLEPLRALLFLAHLSQETLRQQSIERPGLHRLRLGNDLLFWSNAAKFALELLVGQHYLPSLRAEPSGRLSTVWQPFLSDPWVEERRGELAHNMPPICRAYNLTDPESAPAPVTLTEDFVATVVDAAVRTWGRCPETAQSARFEVAGRGQLASAWLHALLADSGALQLPPQPAHELYQSWTQWVEQLYIVRDANFRICFVLEEPVLEEAELNKSSQADDTTAAEVAEAPDDAPVVDRHASWTLRFYLQARDNPSLMIGATEVWQATNHVLQAGNRHIDQPQERLLAGLGVAGRLFPPIVRSMRHSRPEHCVLSTREAYEFLREIAPLLESSGFGVILPTWWNAERRVRLGLRLSFFADDSADFADDNFLDDDYSDEDFSAEDVSDREADDDFAGLLSGSATAPDGDALDRASSLGLNSLVNYKWELTLGDEDLSAAEFEQLTASRTPLLRLRGQWVELDPEQVDATYRFLAGRATQGKTSLLQAIRVAQSMGEEGGVQPDGSPGVTALAPDPEDVFAEDAILAKLAQDDQEGDKDGAAAAQNLSVDSVVVHGWLERVLDQLRNHQPPQPVPAPDGFEGQLRPYQERGVGWLSHLCRLGLGGCLADDMGLGKTIQAIAFILHEQTLSAAQGETLAPTLLICPTSVVANWRREIERFAPALRAMIHHGNNRATGDDFFRELAEHDLVVTSYGTARRDIETLQQIEWNDLILDEAQNIKTPGAKQTQAVRRLQGQNRIALTGTPVENRLSELWSIMEFLNPGYLGKHESFRRQFILPIERYNDSERTAELRRLVQPFLLRRLKSDPSIISDLPEKNEMVVYCSLTREQAKLYEEIVNNALTELRRADGIQRRGLVLALLTKLKQITNHPAHFLKEEQPLDGRSGKLNRLTEMLDEAISVGDRALIFTQFVEMGFLLQRHLSSTLGVETLFLHGGTPANQRDKMVQAFQSEEGPPVFVLSLRAGGSGLNLTQANHVFHYDRWWNPAVENQATDRAFRIGQRRDVQVHKFVVAGTLEERIHDLIENKQALAQSIVGSGEDWLTELETDELRELLMLRQDAIEDDA